ncbi:MAG TPA: HPr(Ser) kinase/phosphatase [Candidatus Latescibacteria bacterium]|nr:HPr(Ser) kinase/phosphatase [Candidatus Latescibacterota bacterium]
MKEITIRELLKQNRRRLALKLIAGQEGLDRTLTSGEIHRPGLALAGFVELYTFDRVQVLGNTEMIYLRGLSEDARRQALETIYQFDLPCIVITGNNEPFPLLSELSNKRAIPLLRTKFATTKFIHLFNLYLDEVFAPQITMHASLVDVYGVGLLFTGRSSIGKSEIALDLVERGHRLVADDVVVITRRAQGILMGTGSDILRHHIEIRGVGIIDVRRTFGIRAVRLQKRIEVEVRLVDWDESLDYERIGLEEKTTSILDIEIPVVAIPIYPGKNITVIAEIVALNHLLKVSGIHPAREFNRRLVELMRRKRQV